MECKFPFLALVVAMVLLNGPRGAADEFDDRYQAVLDSRGRESESVRLAALFKVDWDYAMSVYPELASYYGAPGGDRRWTDLSPGAIQARASHVGRALPVLATIDRARLSATERISYDIFKRLTDESVEGVKLGLNLDGSECAVSHAEPYLISQMGGVQQGAAQTLQSMPVGTDRDLEDQLARLRALPAVIDRELALLQEGVARGITTPQVLLRDVPDQILNQIPDDPLQSPLLAAFVNPPPTVSGERGMELRNAAVKLYAAELRPAYQRLHAYVTTKYLPAARTSIAASELPNGRAWYAWRVRTQTSTDLTPEQIHEIGRAEVKRIRAEMERVKAETGFKGTLGEFFVYLRTDPKFFFTDKEELLRAYRDIAKRIDPQLIRLFKTLPRMPYGVKAVPAYAERSQTTAYYFPGAPEVGRPGYFFANTYALDTRPKWEMQPLTVHEAVPGHHLQISLAQELADLPDFRRNVGYTAFVEGWGLYSESLGDELGLYTDPYDKFGQLTYEMWRAVRLVVDTGMHALGWSREQAIEYFKDNAGKSEHDIVVEVDRYIAWPGQALAYKLGEMKIKELRAFATKELGPRFDVRLFHDEILRNGAVPLSVLDAHIREWVAARKRE